MAGLWHSTTRVQRFFPKPRSSGRIGGNWQLVSYCRTMDAMQKEPKTSPAKGAYHQKQLRKLFPRAGDKQILQMMWAVDALGSGRAHAAAKLLDLPRAALEQAPGSPYSIH